jgi:hypothetical protein
MKYRVSCNVVSGGLSRGNQNVFMAPLDRESIMINTIYMVYNER